MFIDDKNLIAYMVYLNAVMLFEIDDVAWFDFGDFIANGYDGVLGRLLTGYEQRAMFDFDWLDDDSFGYGNEHCLYLLFDSFL